MNYSSRARQRERSSVFTKYVVYSTTRNEFRSYFIWQIISSFHISKYAGCDWRASPRGNYMVLFRESVRHPPKNFPVSWNNGLVYPQRCTVTPCIGFGNIREQSTGPHPCAHSRVPQQEAVSVPTLTTSMQGTGDMHFERVPEGVEVPKAVHTASAHHMVCMVACRRTWWPEPVYKNRSTFFAEFSFTKKRVC